jgi:hypothetical protein
MRESTSQLEAKWAAIQALSNRRQTEVSAAMTNGADVTKQDETEGLPAQVIESNGRPVGTRTPDLYRVKVAL